MVVYRYVDPAQRDPYSPETALSQVCERLVSALNGAGVVAERQSGEQIHAWLLRWFNPDPQWVEKEVLYRTARHHDNPHNALPLMTDFSDPYGLRRRARMRKTASGGLTNSLTGR